MVNHHFSPLPWPERGGIPHCRANPNHNIYICIYYIYIYYISYIPFFPYWYAHCSCLDHRSLIFKQTPVSKASVWGVEIFNFSWQLFLLELHLGGGEVPCQMPGFRSRKLEHHDTKRMMIESLMMFLEDVTKIKDSTELSQTVDFFWK